MHSFMSSLTTASQPAGVHLCCVILYIFLTWTIAQDSRKEKAANTIKYENLEKVHHLSNNKKKQTCPNLASGYLTKHKKRHYSSVLLWRSAPEKSISVS